MSPAIPAAPGACRCAMHPAGSRSSRRAVARAWSARWATTGVRPPELRKAALTAPTPAALRATATARPAPWSGGNGGCAPPSRARHSLVWGRASQWPVRAGPGAWKHPAAGRSPRFTPPWAPLGVSQCQRAHLGLEPCSWACFPRSRVRWPQPTSAPSRGVSQSWMQGERAMGFGTWHLASAPG